jgi:hypothetical protein
VSSVNDCASKAPRHLTFAFPFSSLAQVVLVVPLTTATKEARSPYLKSESFRLLGALFGRSESADGPSELDTRGRESLKANSSVAISCITGALQDEEMLKTKRAKDVLKAASKLVAFQKTHQKASVCDELVELKGRLEQVNDNSESNGVTSACEKLVSEIDDCVAAMKQETGGTSSNKNADSSKKKKKKKGKKKR